MTEPPTPSAAPAGTDYVTASQIATELGVHLQTAQKYFRDDGLPGRKIGKEWTTTREAFNTWLTGGARPKPLEPLEGTDNGIEMEFKA